MGLAVGEDAARRVDPDGGNQFVVAGEGVTPIPDACAATSSAARLA
jgi:hypothetical protein